MRDGVIAVAGVLYRAYSHLDVTEEEVADMVREQEVEHGIYAGSMRVEKILREWSRDEDGAEVSYED